MTGTREIPEQVAKIIGILTGLALWLIWGFLVVSIGSLGKQTILLNIRDPWGFWMYVGPLPLFVGACYYYFNRKYWPVPKQQQQLALLKGGALGFFLWSAVIVILPDIRNISNIFPDPAGWLAMLLIMLYFRKRVRAADLPEQYPNR
jgi:hypothetical protein